MEIWLKFGNWEKVWKFGKNWKFGKKIGNLERNWKFGKYLEIWKNKFENLEKNGNLKKVESFEKIWQFRNFTKKIEILINFLSLEKNLEIWKRFWNLE